MDDPPLTLVRIPHPEPERSRPSPSHGPHPAAHLTGLPLVVIGHTVSFLGDEIVTVVVPYQVYKITGSTLAVGMIGLVTLIPVSVFPMVGGAAADATERRRLIITTVGVRCVVGRGAGCDRLGRARGGVRGIRDPVVRAGPLGIRRAAPDPVNGFPARAASLPV